MRFSQFLGLGLVLLGIAFVPAEAKKSKPQSQRACSAVKKDVSPMFDNMTFFATKADQEAQKGKTLRSFSQEHGGKCVLVIAFAEWCGPCMKEMPSVNALRDSDMGQHLAIAPIAIEEPLNDAYALDNITMPLYFSPMLSLFMSKQNVSGIPAAFLFSPQGELLFVEVGSKDWNSDQNKAMLKKLMVPYMKSASSKKSKK